MHAPEVDYGATPNRDFAQWKQDPRAYGPLTNSADDTLAPHSSDLCIGEDDRVFIECWMDAKWGFHKFPLDPKRIAPGPDELSWRPPATAEPRSSDDPLRLDIPFDLSLPLPSQLEAAKFRLVSGVPAAPMLTRSTEPSAFLTSQVQPEPKLPTALV